MRVYIENSRISGYRCMKEFGRRTRRSKHRTPEKYPRPLPSGDLNVRGLWGMCSALQKDRLHRPGPLARSQASRHTRTFPLGNTLCRPFIAGSQHKCWLLAPLPRSQGAEETWCPARPPDDHNPGSRCQQQGHRAQISSTML